MAETLAEAVVDIRGRLDHLDRSLKTAEQNVKGFTQRASLNLEKLGKNMQRLGRRMTVALTVPIVLLGRKMVMEAARAEESASKFHAVFKEEGAATLRWIDEFSKRVKRSRFEMIDLAANFQDLFVPLGFARDKAAELSRALTSLTFDLASFKDIAEADVAKGLISGMVGMHRALYQFGIVIREDILTQEVFNLGLAATKNEITEQMKVLARFSLIMKGTKDAHGDMIRTAGSFTNRLRGLRAAWSDLSVSMGNILIKQLTPAVEVLTNKLNEFSSLSREAQEEIINLVKAIALIGPAMVAVGAVITALATHPYVAVITVALTAIAYAVWKLRVATEAGRRSAAEYVKQLEKFEDIKKKAWADKRAREAEERYPDVKVPMHGWGIEGHGGLAERVGARLAAQRELADTWWNALKPEEQAQQRFFQQWDAVTAKLIDKFRNAGIADEVLEDFVSKMNSIGMQRWGDFVAKMREKASGLGDISALGPGMGAALQPPATPQWIGGPEQIWKRAMTAGTDQKPRWDIVQSIDEKINQALTNGLPQDSLANARLS